MKEFPYTMTFSQPKTGNTSVMRAVGSVGIPCHRCHEDNVADYHITDMPTITMVREPVARYLSELWERYLGGGEYPFNVEKSVMMQGIEQSMSWFDDNYRDRTGINVYGTQFIKKNGYLIYSIRGLVVATDRMDDVLEKALKDFLPPYFPDADYDSLEVKHLAIGTDRFGKEYQKFVDGIKFPKAFLEKVYEHKFCDTFFYKKNITDAYRKFKE